jgi:uncharacterized OB-fold protein
MTVPVPTITETNRPYWEGLAQGRLRFQRCDACGNTWLPPRCLSPDTRWQDASGRATVVSWVVYHTAYADHLKSRVPYDVTLVELEEGPRLLTNIVDSDSGRRLAYGTPVFLEIETEDSVAIPRFRLLPVREFANE